MIIEKVYGNRIDLKGTCKTMRQREHAMMVDKNEFVRVACRLRTFKSDIKEFKDYQFNTTTGEWIITIVARKRYIKKLDALIRNPQPTLEKWRKKDEKKLLRKARKVKADEAEPGT